VALWAPLLVFISRRGHSVTANRAATMVRSRRRRGRAGSAWPESRGRARELLRNSLRSFSDPVQNDATWPPLRFGQTGRSGDRPSGREPRGAKRGPWCPGNRSWTRRSPVANRQIRCTMKKGSAGEPSPYTRVSLGELLEPTDPANETGRWTYSKCRNVPLAPVRAPVRCSEGLAL
jgi:hypothetical protein